MSDRDDGEPTVVFDTSHQTFRVLIRNAGQGPAVYVRTSLEPTGESNPQSPAFWSLGALAPGDVRPLMFPTVRFNPSQPCAQLLFDYRDLAGRAYSTSITIEVVNDVPHVHDVRVFEGHSVTHHGDAVYPQPGLRDVRPRRQQPAPKFRARISAAVRAFRGQA